MREELLNEILMILIKKNIDITEIKESLYIVLDKFEIQDRTTEIALTDEDRNNELFKRFLIAKTVKGCSKRTLDYYKTQLRRIILMLNKTVDKITAEDIRCYLAKRQMVDKVSKTTADNELRILRSFFRYLTTEEYIDRDPTIKIDRIKQDKVKKEAFTEVEIEKMRNYIKNDKRLKAIFEMLLSTGCRVSELINIKVSDLKDNKVKIMGKGNKERIVYLNAKAQIATEEYLSERIDKNPYLFPKSTKETFSPGMGMKRNWWKKPKYVHNTDHVNKDALAGRFKVIAKNLGIEHANPHKFRRTCATLALRRGMPIEQVSKMLGHESLETTQLYLDISEEEFEHMHKKYVI